MRASLERRIAAAVAADEADRRFAERLLACLDEIDASFRGAERARLRRRVEETLERHRKARHGHRLTLEALERLRDDHRRIADLLTLLAMPRDGRTLH